MAAPVILIEAQPRRASDGVAETVRLAGGGAAVPYRHGGNRWRAGILGLPTIITSLDFAGGELGTGGVPSATEFEWGPSRQAELAVLASYIWADAPIVVRVGPEDAGLPPILIAGRVLQATAPNGRLKVALADPAAELRKPLLTDRYAGTGALEGPVEWAGDIKPRVWGRVWNRRGDPIDKANNIYCFADPARPIQEFTTLRDKGVAAAGMTTVAWAGTAAATLAALQAAAAPAGGGVACPSIACVKWWTEPAGDLCADLRGEVGTGYVEKTAAIAERLVTSLGGPAFAAGTIAAAVASRPAPAGWVASDDNATVAAMLDELLGNSSLLWVLSAAGEIVIREWAWTASAASVRAIDVSREKSCRPLATRKLGYQRNELEMARGDIGALVLSRRISIYKRSVAAPALPSADVTVNYATGAVTGLNNGWTIDPPAGADPLWTSVASVSGAGLTEIIVPGAWAGAVSLAAGTIPNVATVMLYQRSSSSVAPAVPSLDCTYTFASQVLAGANNGWTQTMPTSGGLYYWAIRATALSTGLTDIIPTGEWSPPSLSSVQQSVQSLNGLVPSAPTGLGSLTTRLTFPTGNKTLSGTFSFTKATSPSAANWIDFIEAGTYVKDTAGTYAWGTDPAHEVWRRIELDFTQTAFTHDFFEDVAATPYYTGALRSVRVVDPSIDTTGFIRSAIRSTPTVQPAASQNNTGDIGGVGASTLATVATNFNADNDNNGLVPPAATSVTVGSVTHVDSTAQIGVNWAYTHSLTASAANNIDGFWVGLQRAPTGAGYTYSSGDDDLIEWKYVRYDRRGAKFNGKPGNFWYTAIVIPVRVVRANVASSTLVLGTVAQSSSGAPHRPSPTPTFTGKVDTELASDVANWSGRASVAINADGTIANAKVLTGAFALEAINQAEFQSQSGLIALGASDTFASTYLVLNSTGKMMRVQFVLDYQIRAINPTHDATFALGVELMVQRVSSGVYTYASMVSLIEAWNPPTISGTKQFARQTVMIEAKFAALAGSVAVPVPFNIGYRLTTGAGMDCSCRAYRLISGSDERGTDG